MASRPPGYSEFHLHHMGGSFAGVDPGSTAFPDRRSDFTYNILTCWDQAADDDANRTWARAFAAELDRLGNATGYVNFLTDAKTRPRSTASMAATGTRGCNASNASSTPRTCSGSTRTSSPDPGAKENPSVRRSV